MGLLEATLRDRDEALSTAGERIQQVGMGACILEGGARLRGSEETGVGGGAHPAGRPTHAPLAMPGSTLCQRTG